MRYKGLITWDNLTKSFDFECDKLAAIVDAVELMLSGMQGAPAVSFTCSFYAGRQECNFSCEGTAFFLMEDHWFRRRILHVLNWSWITQDDQQNILDKQNSGFTGQIDGGDL